MPVRALTLEEFEQEAGAAFRRVFASTDPCDGPFTAAMTERALLWSRYKLKEDELLALAGTAASVGDAGFYVTMTERVTAAWHNTKAGGTFSTLAPGHHDQPLKPPVDVRSADFVPVEVGPQEWYIPLSDLSVYLDDSAGRLPLDVENALFSPGGRWGMLFSQHGHLVVGGEPPFLETLLDRWPPVTYYENGRRLEVPAAESVLIWLNDLKTEGGPRYMPGSDPLSWGWLEELLCHIYGEDRAEQLLQSDGITGQ